MFVCIKERSYFKYFSFEFQVWKDRIHRAGLSTKDNFVTKSTKICSKNFKKCDFHYYDTSRRAILPSNFNDRKLPIKYVGFANKNMDCLLPTLQLSRPNYYFFTGRT
jgi:hypothetical protein